MGQVTHVMYVERDQFAHTQPALVQFTIVPMAIRGHDKEDTMVLLILLALLWWAIGIASFVYWWTEDLDLEVSDLLVAVMCGLFGPSMFVIGWLGSQRIGDVVLISRRIKNRRR